MQINLIDNSLKGEIHMAKVEYAPQGVCARLMKFEVEDGTFCKCNRGYFS